MFLKGGELTYEAEQEHDRFSGDSCESGPGGLGGGRVGWVQEWQGVSSRGDSEAKPKPKG